MPLESKFQLILSSGYDEAQVIPGDHSERPQAFLHKPYTKAVLQVALEKTMEKYHEC